MEQYNIKVIEYANGTTEVRKYSKPIGQWGIDDHTDEWRKYCAEKKINSVLAKQLVLPFCEEKKEKVEYDADEDFDKLTEQELKFREMRSLKNSLSRTKQALFSIARQCKWEYFVTLTYDGAKVDRYDYDLCMKKTNTWFANQRKRYASDLQYLFVPEQHKDGAWHVHGLIAQCGNMEFVDSGHKVKDKVIFNLGGWKFGFSTATAIEDTKRISAYITKYITKEVCAVTKGKKRYYRSQNIPVPLEHTYMMDFEESKGFVEMLGDSLGLDVSYTKQIKGEYMDVEYIYLDAVESEEKENG